MAMKIIISVLLTILISSHVLVGDTVSIESFKQITDPLERGKLIDQAPPEQKQELEQINLHLALVAKWGGEAGFRTHKETCIAHARGVGALEAVFGEYNNFWNAYVGSMIQAREGPGMKPEQRREIEDELMKEEDSAVGRQVRAIHSLVYQLAPTPAALELSKRAGALGNQLEKRSTWDGSAPYQPITTEERRGVDREMDQIFDQIGRLPKLTPDQLQKEYNAFTDLDIVKWS